MKGQQEINHKWSSKFGFLMAAVGSAVGLGNIWRFPYVVSEHGGALFLIVYLFIVVILGFMVMSAEFAIGRYSSRSVLDSFKRGKKNWSFIGLISMSICFFIVSYYSVIGGWITKYMFGYMGGGGFVSGGNYGGVFGGFVTSGMAPAGFNFIFLFCSVLVLAFGVKKGIEKVSKVLMPGLFCMLLIVAIVSLTMDGAWEGVKFFLVPDPVKIQESGGVLGIINAAMGQAFFSLSVGIGINCTYGSYLARNTNIPKDSITICGFDTLVAIVAGFAILPAIFAAGADPGTGGAGLIFKTLPEVFTELGVRTMPWFGTVMGFIFFLLVWVAALTSCISLLEVLISALEQKLHVKRLWSTLIVGGVVLVMSTLVSYSQNPEFGIGIDLLDIFDRATVNYLMPVAAIAMCMFVVFVWGGNNASRELTNQRDLNHKWYVKTWKAFVMWICPLLIACVFVMGLIDNDWTHADGSINANAFIALGLGVVALILAVVIGVIYSKKTKDEPFIPAAVADAMADVVLEEIDEMEETGESIYNDMTKLVDTIASNDIIDINGSDEDNKD